MEPDDITLYCPPCIQDLTSGVAEYLRSSNWPEVHREGGEGLVGERDGKPAYIEQGSPWVNGIMQSFQDKLRDECQNQEISANTSEARALIEAWRDYYNNERLHNGLVYKTPVEFNVRYNNRSELTRSS